MDRYVRKGDVSYFGLESIHAETLIKNTLDRQNEEYSIKVQQFKKYMTNKIYKFDPINVKANDKILQLLWLSFLFDDIPTEKQKRLYIDVQNTNN
uniref:Uncharacterized protein n=1 Tax=viral metagenome TaxID=1070528 RepID=A0A6C0B4Z6_9ZZZZ|tara:strand:- start:348 stop:632 length:285 start_codon:yes stop_codon:yes gene_type:complete